MVAQHSPDGDDRGVKTPSKKPYAPPVLLTLGSFSDVTLTVGNQGSQDGGGRNRRSTRA